MAGGGNNEFSRNKRISCKTFFFFFKWLQWAILLRIAEKAFWWLFCLTLASSLSHSLCPWHCIGYLLSENSLLLWDIPLRMLWVSGTVRSLVHDREETLELSKRLDYIHPLTWNFQRRRLWTQLTRGLKDIYRHYASLLCWPPKTFRANSYKSATFHKTSISSILILFLFNYPIIFMDGGRFPRTAGAQK